MLPLLAFKQISLNKYCRVTKMREIFASENIIIRDKEICEGGGCSSVLSWKMHQR